MSYDGRLAFGLLGDYDAMGDLEALADDLRVAIDELTAPPACRVGPRPARVSASPIAAHAGAPEIATPRRRPSHWVTECASPSPRSTPPSATSPATRPRCASSSRARARPARSSRSSPSWRSPATRPRICCSRSTSWPTRARRSSGSPPTRRASWRSSASPSAPTTPTTPRRCSPTAASRPSTARSTCPTTGSSTSCATSSAARAGRSIDVDGVKVGLTICEDIWVPGPPMTDEALAGARLVLNISASPYQAGKGRQREQMIAQRARDSLAAVAFCALVGGQDELVFDGHSFVVDHDGNVIARAPQFAEELLVCDIDVEAAGAARLRDTRARPAAREMAPAVADLGSFSTEGGSRPGGAGRPGRRAARRRRRDLRGARARHARLRDQERLRARRHRAVGRDRLDAGRPHRRRRPRARARDLRDDALAVLVAGHARRRAQAGREPRRRAARAADRRGDGGLRGAAGATSSPGASPTSPRRTCRRASAATC